MSKVDDDYEDDDQAFLREKTEEVAIDLSDIARVPAKHRERFCKMMTPVLRSAYYWCGDLQGAIFGFQGHWNEPPLWRRNQRWQTNDIVGLAGGGAGYGYGMLHHHREESISEGNGWCGQAKRRCPKLATPSICTHALGMCPRL
jgi:hypothetical protein